MAKTQKKTTKADKAFEIIAEILGERKEEYKGFLQPMFVKSQLSATQTAGLINLYYNRGYDRN
jgi:type I restriction enzyme M protein